jgi:hypothetical protein
VGTSSDRSAGSGGAWTPLKRATTSYLRTLGTAGSPSRARRLLGRHVPVLGGTAGAAGSARAGARGIQGFGALLSGMGTADLATALTSIGLQDLVGQDRFSVLDALITFIAGDGGDLDAQAARDAACDVLEDLFGNADQWADLASINVTADDLNRMLEMFLSLYVQPGAGDRRAAEQTRQPRSIPTSRPGDAFDHRRHGGHTSARGPVHHRLARTLVDE